VNAPESIDSVPAKRLAKSLDIFINVSEIFSSISIGILSSTSGVGFLRGGLLVTTSQ